MLKKLRAISILLCGVIFLNGLCIGSASASYTPKQLMAPDEQSVVDKINHDRHDQNNFGSIIDEIDQYYQKKDSKGKSEYSKEFNEYCLSVLFKLYNDILKSDTLYKEFLSSQSKGSKEEIPNIKEVILTGIGLLGGLNDSKNLECPALLYRVLGLELDKKRNKSIRQRLKREDKDISKHMETILTNGKKLLCTTDLKWESFGKLPLITQLDLLRCVGICAENVGLLLSDEELHKILKQISGLSLEEYQKDLKEMADPTTLLSSSSSSSSSNENNIKRNKNLEVKILIQFAKVCNDNTRERISVLEAAIEHFGNFEIAAKDAQGREALIQLGRTSQAGDSQEERDKKISALRNVIDYFGGVKKAAEDRQGREALIQLGRIPHGGQEGISALEAVIEYFFRLATPSPSSSTFSEDEMYKIAARDAQGREALIQLGRIPHGGQEGISALEAVIEYFFRLAIPSPSSSTFSEDEMYKIAARDAQGREALIQLGKIPHNKTKEAECLRAVIDYFGGFGAATKDAQGREALIALGQIKHDTTKEIRALEAVIDYFYDNDFSHKLSLSPSSSSFSSSCSSSCITSPSSSLKPSKKDNRYQIAANYDQGREALIALGQIKHDPIKQVGALEAVIEYFFNKASSHKLSSSSSSSSSSTSVDEKDKYKIAAGDDQGRKALIALGQIKHDTIKQVWALEAVIEYFFNKASSHKLSSSSSSSSSSTSVDEKDKYKIAAGDDQGRKALIALGQIKHDTIKQVWALEAVIEYFFNKASSHKLSSSSSSSSSSTSVDEKDKYKIAAGDDQGRKALIALGQIKHDTIKQVWALESVIEYFFNKYSSNQRPSSSSSSLSSCSTSSSYSSKPTVEEEEDRYEIAAKDEQGRGALIALGQIKHDTTKEIRALNAVIDYFFNKDSSNQQSSSSPLSSSSSSSCSTSSSSLSKTTVKEEEKYKIAADYEQGREALIQWCRIPKNDKSKRVAILEILKKKKYKEDEIAKIANDIFNSLRLNSSMSRIDSMYNNRPIFPHADKSTLLFGNKGPVKDSNMDRFYYNDNRMSSPYKVYKLRGCLNIILGRSYYYMNYKQASTHSHHNHDRYLGDGRRRPHSPSSSSLDSSSTHSHHKHRHHHHNRHRSHASSSSSSPSSSVSSSTHSHHKHHHHHHHNNKDRHLGDGRRRSHLPSFSSLDSSSTYRHRSHAPSFSSSVSSSTHKHRKHHHYHEHRHHRNRLLPKDYSRSHTLSRSRSRSESNDSSSCSSSSSSSRIRQGKDGVLHKKPKLGSISADDSDFKSSSEYHTIKHSLKTKKGKGK